VSTVDRPGLGRRVATAILLASASVLVTLAVLEVGLRLTETLRSPPPPAPPTPPGVRVLTTLRDLTGANIRGVLPGGAPYRTNAHGLRGRDYAEPKPPGVFRIVVIGDSVTMGAGVAEDDTYVARVERALNDPPGAVRYEVVNLGLSGLNAPMNVARLADLGLLYEPDLLVYGYTLNDIEGPEYRRTSEAASNVAGDLSREQDAPHGLRVLTFFRTHLYSMREMLWPPRGSIVWELDDNYLRNPAALAVVDHAFDRLERIARERDLCVVLLQHACIWFLRGVHPFRRHYAVVAELAAEHGFFEKGTFDYVAGHDGTALWVAPFDPHPNAEGHALYAQALLDELRSLPPRCWKR
jgi:lysophospholipase L1-like esterase